MAYQLEPVPVTFPSLYPVPSTTPVFVLRHMAYQLGPVPVTFPSLYPVPSTTPVFVLRHMALPAWAGPCDISFPSPCPISLILVQPNPHRLPQETTAILTCEFLQTTGPVSKDTLFIEKEVPLIKTHSAIQLWIFFVWGLRNCMRGVCFALKRGFCVYLWPLCP